MRVPRKREYEVGWALRAFYENNMNKYFDHSDVRFMQIVGITTIVVVTLTWALL